MLEASAPSLNRGLPAQIGKVWFQWRGLSPVPLFLLMVALPREFTPTTVQLVVFALGVVLSEAVRVWAVGYAGSATRTRGHCVPALVHAGPFRHVRNPLYIGNILLYTSAALLFGFENLALVIFLYSCVQYTFIVRYEEELLANTFGEEYRRYTEAVPRWWFSLTPRYPSSAHQFDLARSLRSERSTFWLIALVGAAWFVKFWYFGR